MNPNMVTGVVILIFGCFFNSSHEAAIAPLSVFPLNNSLDVICEWPCDRRHGNFDDSDRWESGYVKLSPGSDVYFYVMRNKNLIVGHGLQSNEGVTITFLPAADDFSCELDNVSPEIQNSTGLEGRSEYVISRSGVLVPRANCERQEAEKPESNRQCHGYNECVYRSSEPVYYVKGFRNILIPADVLYSKSVVDELKSRGPRRKDPKLIHRRGPDFAKQTLENSNEGPLTDVAASSLETCSLGPLDLDSKANASGSFIEPDGSILPDKSCSGEVTLFLLKGDGVLRRVTPDPYMPIGLRLTFSLLKKLILQPRFLAGSGGLAVTYVTGENGDMIPHPKTSHKITSEKGRSVLFMMSKNGGLFPVEEEQVSDHFVRYYFDGKFVHESHQFSGIYSNSSSIFINDVRFHVFEGRNLNPESGGHDGWERREQDFRFSSPSSRHRHRLRKREAYFAGSDRALSSGVSSAGGVEPQLLGMPPSVPVERNRMAAYPAHSTCSKQGYYVRRRGTDLSNVGDSRCSEIASQEHHEQGHGRVMSTPFDGIRKTADCGGRNSVHPGEDREDLVREPTAEELADAAATAASASDRMLLRPRTDLFIFDEKGTRIRLIPEITDSDDVVIYKLTCKGNLIRYPSCKEPEFGFDINFQLLLDEFVLVPTVSTCKPFHISYALQENGDLVPVEDNVNTFRKAPGSLIYYMLGKNNVLFPVQQVIDMEGSVSFYYQDFFLLKLKDSIEKPLHFTTKGSPLFAFFNGLTVMSISSRPRLSPRGGSNWNQLKPSESSESPPKTMYLTGPKGELIRIAPYKNRQGSTVVYELDCNGILYRSPKDKKKCIILKSYILLKEGILLPSNDTTGYVYMMSKNGDLFPYLYPDGKIEAPLASSLKYVLCEKGILLPIKLEIIDNSICYMFRDVVVYKERVFCKTCLDRLSEQQLVSAKNHKSSCDVAVNDVNASNESDIKLFVNKNGDLVFYERQNKLLKRHPAESVPSYLKYTMGSFEVKADGSLYQIRYQDPCENVVNLMLEPNGDLLEDTRNVNKIRSEYYVLDAKGNLISVDARKTRKSLHFYRGLRKVCKVPIPGPEEANTQVAGPEETKTPLGKDPLRLMQDPYPAKSGVDHAVIHDSSDSRSLYIPIPLKSVSVSNSPEPCPDCGDEEHKKKCEMLKDALDQVSKGNALPLALELELTDDIIEELKNWASKCDKVLTQRDASQGSSSQI